MATHGINGAYGSICRPLLPGVFAAVPTFFLPDSEDIDFPNFEAHILRIARAGLGLVIAGTMGEAIHLSHAERIALITTARNAMDRAGLHKMPIIAGTGAASTRETIKLCNDAAQAGADYCLVIASGFFATVLGGNTSMLRSFFHEVSEKSEIPIMVYNYPAASGGIDLDSEFLIGLAADCPNLCGVKLTCANIGKLTRIASVVSEPSFASLYPRKRSWAPFLVLGGYADVLLPSVLVHGHGIITGLGNIAPHAIHRLFQLAVASQKDLSILPEAQRLQNIIARAEGVITKTSVAGTKFILENLHGYGGVPRRPLPALERQVAENLWSHPYTRALIELERGCRMIMS